MAPAERSGLVDGSVHLVAAAQAVHWFDIPAFFAEARRVLVADGVIAVWCYDLPEVTPPVDDRVRRFYAETVGPHWPPERRLVETRYRTIAFPFAEFSVPPFHIEQALTLAELAGYVRTWSATLRYVEARGHNPVDQLFPELAPHWGDPSVRRRVRWPLALRAGWNSARAVQG